MNPLGQRPLRPKTTPHHHVLMWQAKWGLAQNQLRGRVRGRGRGRSRGRGGRGTDTLGLRPEDIACVETLCAEITANTKVAGFNICLCVLLDKLIVCETQSVVQYYRWVAVYPLTQLITD